MKSKLKLVLLSLLLTFTFVFTACSNDNTDSNSDEATEVTDSEEKGTEEVDKGEKNDFSDKLEGEDGVVRWVRGHSGNLMMTMAEHNGYLEEYGLKVEQIPMQTTDESFSAVAGDQVDIVSNAGTNTPLQRIASGDDLVIFGGHMVEGAVNLIGRPDIEFNDISDLIGSTMAGNPSDYVYSGPLLELGYDPINDVNWVQIGKASDAITAIKNGEVDYASVGTSMSHQVKTDPQIQLIASQAEIMPKYSCCRMETASRFIDDKPNTTKALLKALLRGMRDVDKDPEAAAQLLAEELDVPLEFIEAYVFDDGYEIHPDPLYNSCVRAWAYLDLLGFLDENAKNMDLREGVNVELYKEALDEVIEEVGEEDPEYWEAQLDYFEEHNSMYFDEEEEAEYFQSIIDNIEKHQGNEAEKN